MALTDTVDGHFQSPIRPIHGAIFVAVVTAAVGAYYWLTAEHSPSISYSESGAEAGAADGPTIQECVRARAEYLDVYYEIKEREKILADPNASEEMKARARARLEELRPREAALKEFVNGPCAAKFGDRIRIAR